MIIRGRNHYPQDIELTVENAHEALQLSGGAAFSVELNLAEQLVVVQEVQRSDLRGLSDQNKVDEIVLAIRRAVSEAHELQLYAVLLLKPGSLPKTSSGKVQRKQCRAAFLNDEIDSVAQWKRELLPSVALDEDFSVALDDLTESEKIQAVEAWLINRIAQRLQISPAEIDRQEPLASYGLDSLQVIEMSAELEAWLKQPVFPTIVYDFPTVEALARQLVVGSVAQPDSGLGQTVRQVGSLEAIAVVGAGCRFPGAPDLPSFWQLLQNGQDAIIEVPLSRWATHKTESDSAIQWGGFLKQIDQFDPNFFGISPREATTMDPQQRLLLEVCWETLENSGLSVDRLAGSQSGIFIGVSNGDYSRLQGAEVNTDVYYGTGNAFSIAANRLSYLFDWHGPSWAIDTACSSALVAVHQACASLRTGECDLALAGGVNLILDPQLTVTFSQAQMIAADGRCKTFDASADGYVRSEGCGVVALKRLADAQRDGDNILGVVQGSAVNQDGRSNGLTAPNSLAQQSVIRQALANAGVQNSQIDYVEAHGTGTALGDPIEVNALKAVFSAREEEYPCWLGSVKTNIGHLEPAAGIAGLIKVLLALQQEEIPPHLHLQKTSPYIQLEDSPLKIPTEAQAWKRRDADEPRQRIAGVSAFGFGGTNAHVIVSEAPLLDFSVVESDNLKPASIKPRPLHLLALSAKNKAALQALVQRYQDFLQANTELALADICFTANVGRSHFNHRLAIQATSIEQLQKRLQAIASNARTIGVIKGECSHRKPPKIAFLFTGQGSQYADMGRQLYETQPTFRQAMDECDRLLTPLLDRSLLSVLYSSESEDSLLNQTAYTQPALFAIEYALAKLWQSWGIQPDAVLGHSVGEYAAACIAGVFSLEDGLRLIAERGRLMQALPDGGEMLSVLATVERVREWIEPYEGRVAIAAINGPESVVISGEGKGVSAIARLLNAQDIKNKKLTVSHAFHSPLMEPILDEFGAIARNIEYSAPSVPFASCMTGELVDSEIASAQYWIDHIQQSVNFQAGISTLHQQKCGIYLEIGPKPLLLGMGKQCLPPEAGQWLPSLRPGQSDWQPLLQSLGQFYISGIAIDWKGYASPEERLRQSPAAQRRVLLPTYPFQRQRYWSQAAPQAKTNRFLSTLTSVGSNSQHPLIGQQFHSPVPPIQFQSQISAQNPEYLAAHRVFGKTILPAAAYLEMAAAAGMLAQRSAGKTSATKVGSMAQSLSWRIADVTIQRGLFLPEKQTDSLTLQTILTPLENGIQQFQIFSLELKESAAPRWICHAEGEIQPAETTLPSAIDLARHKGNFSQQIPVDSYYQKLHQRGLEYGADFRAIQQLWVLPRQALGELSLPDNLSDDGAAYQLHPVLLDAGFQLLAAEIGEISNSDTYLPAGLKRLQIYKKPGEKLWAMGSIAPPDEENPKQLVGDVQFFDESGAVAQVDGLTLNRTNREVLLRVLQPAMPPALYKLLWMKSAPPALQVPLNPAPLLPVEPLFLFEPDDTSRTELENWLIFSTQNEAKLQLVEQLRQKGYDCIVVASGESFQQIDAYHYQVDPLLPEDFIQLLQSVSNLKGVLLLAEGTGADSAIALYLVQALSKARMALPLWLVTRGAQTVEGKGVASKAQVHQGALWGLGRAIALEHPELNCRRVDLAPDEDNSVQLVQELLSPTEEDQIAYRNGERYVARLSDFEDAEGLAVPAGQFQLKLKEYGLLDNLVLTAGDRTPPNPHEVEIRVAAAGLNFRDVLNALGLLKDYYAEHLGITQASQLTFGFECAGTVVAVGESVADLQVGDAVMATMLTNGVSQFVTARAEFVIPKPENMSFAEAATLPLAFLTAYYGLQQLANIQAGDCVLIHAAAGGVGQAAVQVAQAAGAEIFATASSAKWDFLRAQGIRHVMNSRTLDFADEILEITNGKGVDVVLNSLNGEFIDKSFEAIAPDGRFVELGKIGVWDESRVKRDYPNVTYSPFDLGEVTRANPELIRDLWVDLGDRFNQNQFKSLPIETFSIQQSVQAFRYMQQAKHIGKVVLTLDEAKPSHLPIAIDENSSYLITGGLGALGLKVAQWMVKQGGRHIVLVGRRSPSEQARGAIAQMESQGASISVKLGDISQPDAVEEIIHSLAADALPDDASPERPRPPLKGIVHAAGVLDDGLLSQLSWAQFSRVMAPKVQGAWHLHEATQESLDFFVCFSSIAALIGSPGQGNYAAANAVMDALMQHRQSIGLPGLSINWGPWANAGMAAQLDATAQNRMSARGVYPIAPEQGLNILGELLAQSNPQVGAFAIDWPKFTAQLPPGVSLPVLKRFQSATSDAYEASRLQGLEQLKQISAAKRRTHLMQHIQSEIADVLGYDSPDAIALNQPLADLGVDSLMAVELANQLEHSLGPTIPASFLFEHPTLEGLVGYLIEQMPSVEFQREDSSD